MGKIAECSSCGKERKLVGRGLCCACYHRERRKGFGRRARAGDPDRKENFTVAVDFAPMAFLLEELRKRAATELRDVGCQVLWELNKSLGVSECLL